MADHAPELFRSRSTTQEFLYSQSEERIVTEPAGSTVGDRDEALARALADPFPGMLDRQGLIAAIDDRLAGASALCVVAVQIDAAPETATAIDAIVTVVRALADRCRTLGGLWGRIGCRRFALTVPGWCAADGKRLAADLLAAGCIPQTAPITIGVAAFPTLDDTRGQTVENADKALDHGCFFGSGSVTGFDAVSLNISGDRFYQAGDIDRAIDAFLKGLRLDPTDVNLHNSLGVCFGLRADYDKALAAFEHAIRLAPTEVMPVYNKGYLLSLRGQSDAALECFLEAQRREPDIFEVLFHIGQTYMALDDAATAREYLTAATRTNPRSGPAHKLLGDCLDRLGQTREAIQACKRAVKINPEDAESLSNLGRLYVRLGESLDVAAVMCEQSVRLDPKNGLFRHHLGRVYLHQDKLDVALAEFELATVLGHDSRAQIAETQDRMLGAKAS